MSVSRPVARCVLRQVPSPCPRTFSTTSSLSVRSRFRNISAEDMGFVTTPASKRASIARRKVQDAEAIKNLYPYSEQDKQLIQKVYSPEQQAVIEAGEASIDPKDLLAQGRVRTDPAGVPMIMQYHDDFAMTRPVVDFVQKPAAPTKRRNYDYMNHEDMGRFLDKAFVDASADYMAAQDEAIEKYGITREAWWEKQCKEKGLDPEEHEDPRMPSQAVVFDALQRIPGIKDRRTGKAIMPVDVIAPALPVVEDIASQYVKEEEPDEKDPEGKYDKLRSITGMTLQEILTIKTKILVKHRVVNQTRLGKVASVYALAIAGNGQGMLGIGEGKSIEPDEANFKARFQAIRTMKPVARYEDRTIFGEVEAKVSATTVQLFSRPPGFGLRCQHHIFELARTAGIQDLAAKVPGSRNKMNTVKATYEALTNQRLPDEIARGRGKKLVDVRKVYYGGNQPLPKSWHEFNDQEERKRERQVR